MGTVGLLFVVKRKVDDDDDEEVPTPAEPSARSNKFEL